MILNWWAALEKPVVVRRRVPVDALSKLPPHDTEIKQLENHLEDRRKRLTNLMRGAPHAKN